MVIVYPNDIKREEESRGYLEATNLPYGLTAFYSEGDGYLSIYSKGSEIKKLGGLTKKEAECLIIGAISTYDLVISILYQEGFIYDENRIDEESDF